MWNYNYTSNEFYHDGIFRKKHKYYQRVWLRKIGNKNIYRYFYDKESYDAYLNKKNNKEEKKTEKEKKTKKKSVSSFSSPLSKSVKSFISELSANIEKNKNYKYTNRVLLRKEGNRNIYRYFYDEITYNKFVKNSKSKIEIGKKYILKASANHTKNSKSTEYTIRQLDGSSRKVTITQDDRDEIIKRYNLENKTIHNGKIVDVDSVEKTNIIQELVKKSKSFVDSIIDSIKIINNQDDVPLYVIPDENGYAKVDDFSYLTKKDKEYSRDEDMSAVNPNFDGDTDLRYSTNCSYCTVAYDLRRRGYDVTADSMDPGDDPTNKYETASWYKGVDIVSTKSLLFKNNPIQYLTNLNNDPYDSDNIEHTKKVIEDELKRHGDGARGDFGLYWKYGGGHSIVWEVIDNEVIFRDTQINSIINIEEYLQRCRSTEYYRVDNLELDEEILTTIRTKII